jgi:hypothetical protein
MALAAAVAFGSIANVRAGAVAEFSFYTRTRLFAISCTRPSRHYPRAVQRSIHDVQVEDSVDPTEGDTVARIGDVAGVVKTQNVGRE